MKRTVLLFSAGMLLALAFIPTACDGGDPELSLEEYFQQVATAREDGLKREKALEDELDAASVSASTDEEIINVLRDFVNAGTALVGDFIAQLIEIDPPAEAEGAHNDLVDKNAEFEELLEDFANKLEAVKSVSEADDLVADLDEADNEIAQRILDACLELQNLADDNKIEVDLQCREEPLPRGAEQEQDENRDLPGVWIDPGAEYSDSAPHVTRDVFFCEEEGVQELSDSGRATCYTSNPPTSGPHAPSPANWGIYDDSNPVPKEVLPHNMEHGGVIVTYNCTDCDELVQMLRDIVEGYLRDGRLIVMTPYDEMEEETIALTGWSRLDKFPVDEFEEDRVRDFIEIHERRFNPENF